MDWSYTYILLHYCYYDYDYNDYHEVKDWDETGFIEFILSLSHNKSIGPMYVCVNVQTTLVYRILILLFFYWINLQYY